jgi:hypothetical protein
MIIEQSKTGFYFKLESQDFKADWGSFLREIKKLRSSVYEPAEMDESNFWFIGQADYKLFLAFKELFIDRPLRDLENYKSIGFKPIPRPGGKFAKPKLKY